jgi:MFS family permease
MALSNLAVFGGAFFTPILVGKITYTIGWDWSFYFVAIFCGVCLPLVFFFVPETAYRRSAHLNTDFASTEDVGLCQKPEGHELHSLQVQNGSGAEPTTGNRIDGEKGYSRAETANPQNYVSESGIPKKTFTQMLAPFSGRKSDESYWKLLLRPFPLFAHPAILWACLIQGTMIGWTVFIGIVLASIFLGPPNFWSEVNTGYAYTGAFIGSVLGFFIAGGLADWSAKYMTRKNKGIYEPEFRLVLVIPQFVFGIAGLYGFGATASQYVLYSFYNFSLTYQS